MPAVSDLSPLEHERKQLEVDDMVQKIKKDYNSVSIAQQIKQQQKQLQQQQHHVIDDEDRTVNEKELYYDPYINVQYRFVDDGVVGVKFDEVSYIEGSQHDPDPLKLNSFDQQKSDAIGKLQSVD
eukprot:sb/3475687/